MNETTKMVLNSLLTHLWAIKNEANLEFNLYMANPTLYTSVADLTLQQYLSLRLDTIVAVDAKINYLQKKFSTEES